jgi:hypothetical protein
MDALALAFSFPPSKETLFVRVDPVRQKLDMLSV